MEAVSQQAKEEKLKLDIFLVNKGAHLLRALRNKKRQIILKLIHEQESMIAGDIYKKLHMEQSETSHHLGILRLAKFVNTQRKGKQIFYFINHQQLEYVQGKLREMFT